jgi:O-antigen/teichoic acid export membrane protein
MISGESTKVNPAWTRFLPEFVRRKIEGRHVLQKVIGNTGWMMGDQVLRMGVGLLVGVWVARYLGPELYGQFSYAIAFAMLFSPLAMLGLDGIVIRNFARNPSSRDELLGTSFPLMIAGGLAVFALAMAGIFIIRPADALAHWLVGITIAGAIFHAFNAIEFWFDSQLQWKFTFMGKIPPFLLVSLAKIGLIVVHAPLVAFAWAGLAEVAMGAAGLVLAYRANGHRLKAWRFNRATAGTLLKDSWPLMFSMVMTMIYLRIDQVMLGDMAGSGELGVYSVAVRLTEIWVFIPTAICSSVLPAIVEAETVSAELFYEQLQKLYKLMALVAYVVAIPVMFLSGWLVETLFGSAYAKAGPLLAVLIWTGLFTNLGTARTVFMISKNWTRVYFICMILGGIVNILLNYLLIPVYGAKGAVIATCLSYWFAVHGTCFLIRPLRETGWMLTKAIVYPKVW